MRAYIISEVAFKSFEDEFLHSIKDDLCNKNMLSTSLHAKFTDIERDELYRMLHSRFYQFKRKLESV